MNNKTYDHIIVGGGFAGSAIAYQLARRGYKVLVIDMKNILSGSSGACAGRVQLIESETEDYLQLVWRGYQRVKGLHEELDYDLEWENPDHLTLLKSEKDWKEYEALVARLKRAGIPAYMMDLATLQKEEPILNCGDLVGAAYSCEGHVNPFKFCMGFLRAAMRYQCEFMPFSPLTGFETNGHRLDGVVTPQGSFHAGSVILATGAWAGEVMALLGLKFPMQFTHAEAQVSERMPRMLHHHFGLPGFYEAVHVQDSAGSSQVMRKVTLGAAQHATGSFVVSNAIEQAEKIDLSSSAWGMPAVGRALLEYLPALKNIKIVRTWAAPSPFMSDYLPAIGRITAFDNLYTAVGFHLAIPTIPVLTEDLTELILENNVSQYLERFDPARFLKN